MCRRAVAAAERCLLVKPQHLELHVYAAALCFLDQNLHRCQQHLQLVYGGLDALGMQCATGTPPFSLVTCKRYARMSFPLTFSCCIVLYSLNFHS